MPLRTPNDQDPANLVMQALALVLPGSPTGNTVLAQASAVGTNIAVNSWGALYGPGGMGATFPFLMLEEDRQHVTRQVARTWQGNVVILANYINRWDRNPAFIDSVWSTVDTDLRRMKANLEDNPTLTVQVTSAGEGSPVRHAVSIRSMGLSPYRGSMNLGTYPFGLVARTMSIEIELPPYLGAA